ncbi:hypothetical protein [Natrinema marinum]|uniref:hypothetical protein n=1 Tax=Natrinema marinum TaxID=2961598 RepID=UPI003CE4F7E1
MLAARWGEDDAFAVLDSFLDLGDRYEMLWVDRYEHLVDTEFTDWRWGADRVGDRPILSDLWKGPVEDRLDDFAEAYQPSERCQGPALSRSSGFAEQPRGDESARLERLLRDERSGDGKPIVWLARVVFGRDVESGDADWRWTRRECERLSGVDVVRPTATHSVVVDDDGDEPTFENRETAADLVWASIDESALHSSLDTVSVQKLPQSTASRSTAKSRAAGMVSRRQTIETTTWACLIGSLGAYRAGIGDLEEPDPTRFTDRARARKPGARLSEAFDRAGEKYERGVILTGTTKPSRFPSIADGAAELTDDVTNLRKWLGRRLDGGIPPSITCFEPTKHGVGHPHSALFGVDAADIPIEDVKTYWQEEETVGRGHQVTVEPIAVDETGSWYWLGDGPDDAGCPPAAYLKEGARALETAARTDADDILVIADAYRDADESTDDLEPSTLDVPETVMANPDAIRIASWYFSTNTRAATNGSAELRS